MLGKRLHTRTKMYKAVPLRPSYLLVGLVACALCCVLTACAQPAATDQPKDANESAWMSEPQAEKNEVAAEGEATAKEVVDEEVDADIDEGTDAADENATEGEPAAAKKQDDPKMQKAEASVRSLVEGYGDRVAVSVKYLDGRAGFAINDEKEFASASMIKLLVLARLLEAEHSGALDANYKYELASKDIVGGTGHISGSALGTAFTYDELASAMIAYSDNTATNVLIDALGMKSINDEAKSLGLQETRLERKMMDTSGKAENYMSARDATTLLCGFANGTIAGKDESAKAITYLKAQTDKDGLAKGIPEDVSFAHKTGTLASVRHDGGVVYAKEPYAIVMFTSLGEAEANGLMAKVSSAVYTELKAS